MVPDTFYLQFKKYLQTHSLMDNCQTLIIAVSGGVDSMVMLSLFLKYKEEFNFLPLVAHLHHQLRKNADKEAELVTRFCEYRKIKLHLEYARVHQYARRHKVSIEMAGRDLRYEMLERLAELYPHSLIATAHNLNDSVETILLNFIKGAGVRGLSGIPTFRARIIRPLLFASKESIYQYARSFGVPFLEDESNQENDFQRNLIRNKLIPLAVQINPKLISTLNTMAFNIREVADYLESQGREAFQHSLVSQTPDEIVLEISHLKRYFIAIVKEVIRQTVNILDFRIQSLRSPNLNTLIRSLDQSAKIIRLDGDIEANIDRGHLIIRKISHRHPEIIAFKAGERIQFAEYEIAVSEISNTDYHTHLSPFIEFIDADHTDGQFTVRTWRDGDRFRPLGCTFDRKLSDFFVDQKIPRIRKHLIPLLICRDRIVWVCGLRLSDDFKVTASTKRILKCEIKIRD